MENYTGDNLHLFVEGFADGGSDPEAAIDFMAWYQPRVSVYKTFYEYHKTATVGAMSCQYWIIGLTQIFLPIMQVKGMRWTSSITWIRCWTNAV